MTVGETLTAARYRAGLTVDELSDRTRIRGTVIRSIEQDDYEACGGDLYVRGYVRALAGAVGIDAQPLIREFDLGRAGGDSDRANGPAARHAKSLPRMTAPTAFDLLALGADPAEQAHPAAHTDPAAYTDPAEPGRLAGQDRPAERATGAAAGPVGRAAPDATRLDLPPVSGDLAATAFDLPLVAAVPPEAVPPAAAQPPDSADTRFDLAPLTDDLMAAGYDLRPAEAPGNAGSATHIMPAVGPGPAGPQTAPARSGMAGKKRRTVFAAVAGALVLAALGVLGTHLASGSTPASSPVAAASPSPSGASAAAAAKASAAARASAAASVSAAAKASAAAAARASAAARAAATPPVTSLHITAAMAFGPDGLADGDNSSMASNAISSGASQPWSTQWYDTAQFGMLKHGTGLLLDLGGKVTITSVLVDLSQYRGADLQLRVGNGTAPQDLRVVATAANVGGAVRLTLHQPATAGYLLIWFTKLPQNGSGQYQETISHVAVTGRR